MPSLKIGTAGTTSFTALIDRDELIVVQLKKRDDSLRLSVSSLNKTTSSADGSPRSAKTTRPLREESVIGNPSMHNRFDAVIDLVKITGRELRMECT